MLELILASVLLSAPTDGYVVEVPASGYVLQETQKPARPKPTRNTLKRCKDGFCRFVQAKPVWRVFRARPVRRLFRQREK